MSGQDWRARFGDVTVGVCHIGHHGARVLPDVPAQAWRRAAKFVGSLGVEPALAVLDERAEGALLAGRVASASRWRDIMAAIHALSEDERPPGEMDQ